MGATDISYQTNPPVANDVLTGLFQLSWPDHTSWDFVQVLRHSLAYVCAFHQTRLVGFVNIAWDGGLHAFLRSDCPS